MPIFWTEERVSKSGARLPYTEIRVGDLTLRFNGRFGTKLSAAVRQLERRQEGAEHHGEDRSSG